MKAPWERALCGTLWGSARFDPGTAMLIAAGASAAGSLVQGIQQSKAADYNAAVAGNQATQVQGEAAAEAQLQDQQNQRRIGEAITAAGASGVDTGSGSPVSVVSDLAQQGNLSTQLTLYRGTVQANALRQQGALDRYQGNQALIGGVVKAGASALSGYAQYAYLNGGGGGGTTGPNISTTPLGRIPGYAGYTPGAY